MESIVVDVIRQYESDIRALEKRDYLVSGRNCEHCKGRGHCGLRRCRFPTFVKLSRNR